jgi:hypothetical protein
MDFDYRQDSPALNSLYGVAEACITNPQPRRVILLNWQRDDKGVAMDSSDSAFTCAWEFIALPREFGVVILGLQRSPANKPKGHKQLDISLSFCCCPGTKVKGNEGVDLPSTYCDTGKTYLKTGFCRLLQYVSDVN